jgi:hypothetical protein
MKPTSIYVCKTFYSHDKPCCKTMCTGCFTFLSLCRVHSYDKPTDDEKAVQKAVPKPNHKKRSAQRQSMRKSSNKVPEYKADENGCQHDNPKQYEKEEHLNHFLGESNRAARAGKGEKNMSLVCMDCNKHHLTGVVILQ